MEGGGWRVEVLGLRVEIFEFRVSGFGFRVSSFRFGCRVKGSGVTLNPTPETAGSNSFQGSGSKRLRLLELCDIRGCRCSFSNQKQLAAGAAGGFRRPG